MIHPSVAELMALVAGDPVSDEVRGHASACASCRRLAGLGDPVTARVQVDVITVDPALYHGREPLLGGGMGQALRAWDRRLGREIVIKQVGPLDDAAARARLQRRLEHEARVTARLDHPGIVTVHELGRWPDGDSFYTMPLVRGEPLDHAISACPSFAERLALLPRVAAVASAIAYAHDRGVVHRDLKPANVVLGRFGETVVIDWGLARDLAEPSDAGAEADGRGPGDARALELTALGVGTPAYMPPEQARGAAPDPRADVYALGATLYHLLAGAPPYAGGDERRRLLAGPPPPIATVAPTAPADLRAIVDKAMARDPAARFPTALPLADELQRYLAGQLTETHRYRPGELMRHWLRRHRTVLRVAAVALVAVVAVAGWSLADVLRARDRAEAAQRAAEHRRRTAEAALARSRAAQASMLARTPTRRLDALLLAAEAVAPTLRAGASLPVELAQGLDDALIAGPIAEALDAGDHPGGVAVSPDGTRVALVASDGAVQVRAARDGARLGSARGVSGAVWARFVDADHLAVWGPGTDVSLLGLDGTRVDLAVGPGALVAVDGGAVITAAAGGGLRRWGVTGVGGEAADASCTPRWLDAAAGDVALACDGGVTLWRPATGEVTRLAAGRRADHVDVDAPHGWLYAVLDGHAVVRWDLARAHVGAVAEALVDEPTARIHRADPTPDGGAVSINDGGHHFLDVGAGVTTATRFEPYSMPRTAEWAAAWYGQRAAVRLAPRWRDVALVLRGHRTFGRASGAVALGGTRTLLTTDSGESWLWDSRLGVDAGVLPDHRAEIVGIAEDDGRVVTASLDGGVTVTTRAGEIVGHQNAGAEILAWAPRARLAGLRDGRVLVLAADGAPVRELAHGGAAVTAVAVTADGSLAATGSLDGSIAVWSLPDGVERARVASDRDAVAALVFVGGRLVEGRRSGVVRVRRTDGSPEGALQLEASIARLIDDGAGQIAIATVAGAGQRMGLDGVSVEALPGAPLAAAPGVIAMGGPGGEVYVERGGGATVLVGRHDLPVSHAVFAPDGAMLWTADDGGALRGWDLTTRRPWVALTPGDHAITALTITGDGAWLIIGLADGSVRVVPATLSATRARACSTLRDHGRSPPSGLCP